LPVNAGKFRKINKNQYTPQKNSKKLWKATLESLSQKATKLASVWTYRTRKTSRRVLRSKNFLGENGVVFFNPSNVLTIFFKTAI
jgi:hypothetical protein